MQFMLLFYTFNRFREFLKDIFNKSDSLKMVVHYNKFYNCVMLLQPFGGVLCDDVTAAAVVLSTVIRGLASDRQYFTAPTAAAPTLHIQCQPLLAAANTIPPLSGTEGPGHVRG